MHLSKSPSRNVRKVLQKSNNSIHPTALRAAGDASVMRQRKAVDHQTSKSQSAIEMAQRRLDLLYLFRVHSGRS